MKKFKDFALYVLLFIVSLFLWSCSEEKLDPNSIFETEKEQQNEFDKWLYTNLTVPYNIQFKYKFDDKESDNTYNLSPAEYDKSVAIAKLVKHLWIDSYNELMGKDFLAQYSPRLFFLVGSKAYNSQGSVVLGTAEGGLKITLYNVNSIDLEELDIDMLNYWYFKTMHHEFAHILHQTKNYTTDFNLISASDYQSGSWVNVNDTTALNMGFISPYGSSETQEDFVELIAVYVTNTEAHWQALLAEAGEPWDKDDNGKTGKAKIEEKFAIVKDYLATSWNIDIKKLREIVLRRCDEVETLDLQSFD
ncbi:MAG TPA: hypothetical protein DEF88_16225 [Porphyromonadaceae bacterium]|jgi:substrate import-associated zinc metallohydrolase lipoprotein|nr:hypothetical protein [Porphyromonadaceae bacterium]HBX21980.1 hypothetical protein [Porphyromonadaceae bacterium]HCM22296.1 hypothetical protein [Porphyromonadaceae bacterium]